MSSAVNCFALAHRRVRRSGSSASTSSAASAAPTAAGAGPPVSIAMPGAAAFIARMRSASAARNPPQLPSAFDSVPIQMSTASAGIR
ncbi:Uncharacterised protein [Mycobacteroides abscessus subsp. abscessus]|nr:Uncharacterised protein [Mycobacteroides abscessus subsp. abscessus]